MQIWIVVNGEQAGPFTPSEIRRGIENGSYDASTPAWQRGITQWTTLGALPSVADALPRAADPGEVPPVLNQTAPESDTLAALPAPVHPFRRFFARWCDLHLYLAAFWIAVWTSGRDVATALASPWVLLLLFIPWALIEAAFLHKTGTTPGKWLLGLSVTEPDGSRLSILAAWKRSMLVLFAGVGMGMAPISWICQALSLFAIWRHRRTLWDQAGKHRVHGSTLRPARVVLFAVLLITSLQLQVAVTWPSVWQRMKPTMEKISPGLAAEMERNPPPHLPPRR